MDTPNKSYVSSFLKLKCAGDIINILNPVPNLEKEITESYAILRKIKPLILAKKNKYNVLDLCAGNALTSVMAAFILPIHYAVAVDKKKKIRDYSKIRKFKYVEENIYEEFVEGYLHIGDKNPALKDAERNTLIIASHPCKHAVKIIDLFNNSIAKALCIVPCCNGSYLSLLGSSFLHTSGMTKYDVWTYYLASLIDKKAKVTITTDHNIYSPKDNIIYAERR